MKTLVRLGTIVVAAAWATVGYSAGEPVEPHPITHEDLWLMPRLGDPVPSSDGRWVVFTVMEPAYEAKDGVVDLWLVAADSRSEPRRLTSTKGAESGADWSPDGKRLAFSAKRGDDEANQIYVLDLARGGEAVRVTAVSTGARQPVWSPDGRQIAFVSELPTGDPARHERKANVRVYEQFPIRHWDRWLDDKQARLFVQEAQPGAPARDLLAASELVRQPGFGARLENSGPRFSPAWAPDGRSLVFVATANRHAAAYAEVTYALYEVELEGGEPRRLTPPGASYDHPTFSPDGRSLAAQVSEEAGSRLYTLDRIARLDWPADSSAPVVLTRELDRSAKEPLHGPDGTKLYFTAEEAGHEKIFSVTSRGVARLEHDPGRGVWTNLAAGGHGEGFRLFGLWQDATQPPEVYVYDPATHRSQRLTRLTEQRVGQLDLPPVETFTFTSRGGRTIHNFLVRPAQYDVSRKYPVIAVIHGGPHTMYRDQWVLRWNYHLLAGTEYVLVLTNYTGSTGFGEAFAQAIQGDPFRTPGEEINQAVEEAIRRFPFLDGTRQAAAGASYGGHLANWLQATTKHYRCLVSHAGLVNPEAQWGTSDSIYHRERMALGPVWEQGAVWQTQNPARLAGAQADGSAWVTPMLITVGEQDFRVPLNNSLESWSLHQRLRIPSRLLVFPDENHWILKGENSRFWYGEVRAWWARWLGDPHVAAAP